MKLKCIGGELDGEEQEVNENSKLHDFVRLSKTKDFVLPKFEEDVKAFREGKVPEYVIIQYVMYKICALYGTKDGKKLELKYLIPQDWNEWDAILYQFSK